MGVFSKNLLAILIIIRFVNCPNFENWLELGKFIVGGNGFLGDQEILFYCILMTVSFLDQRKENKDLKRF
jgi:hypothetical protein